MITVQVNQATSHDDVQEPVSASTSLPLHRSLCRRYTRADPAVTQASFERRAKAAQERQIQDEGVVGWKPFTLF